MGSTFLRFLLLAFQPFPKLLGAVITFVPGGSVLVIAGVFHYGLWAGFIFFIWLVGLLLWAGYRLQKQNDGLRLKREMRDSLGKLLSRGQTLQYWIRLAAAEESVLEDSENDESSDGLEGKKTHDKLNEWVTEVEEYLRGLGGAEVVLFRNELYLSPVPPPYEFFSDHWARAWERHARRCMRLEELIKEIPRE